VWKSEQDIGFNKVKDYLANSPILTIPDCAKPFYLFVDASNIAVGAALCQMDKDNFYHPVCYFSRKLNPAQCNYCITDREALAIVLAVRTFKPYLTNSFTIFTDHEPLTYITKMATKSQRILRWALELSPYEITISHIKGSINYIADFLSRPTI
jgi:hypothetical protein